MFKLSVVSPSATYALVGSLAATDEGTNVTITLNTTGVQRSQSLPFTISGTGITLEDFEGLTQLTGSFTVGANGSDSVNLSVRADQLTEGQETFTVTLLDGLASVDVILNDTSLSAALFNSSTTLLLRADGANNQNNNVFVDSSSNNFAITRVGNTTQGSFSPFVRPEGQWGVAFDGGSLAVNSPPPALVDWYSGTFTIEAWIYPQTLTGWHYSDGGSSIPAAIGNASTTAMTNFWSFGPISNGTVRMYYWNGTQQLGATSTQTVNIGQWNHIAMCKNASNQVQIFVNGVGSGWIAINGTPQSSSGQPLTIGRISNTTPSGMISNVRIVSGAALYTANFTPSTSPLTAVAGTQLLTCQSNRFRDNSTNNFTVTPTGTPRVVVDSPFTREYNPATMGGSAYFDGAGDNLIAPNSPVFGFGTEDYTVEGWFYQESTNIATIFDIRTGAANTSVVITIDATGNNNRLVTFEGGQLRSFGTPDNTPRRNSWNHIAVARGGGVVRLFVNGVLVGSYSSSTNYGTTQGLLLGANYGADLQFRGFMSNINVIKGSAVYTTNFTPPTAPVTSTPQTSLLLNFTNGGVVDSTGRNVLETVGDARISTAVVRPGQTSSMFFDGTGDWISTPNSAHFNFSTTSPFTIEAWIYYTPGTHRGIIGARINGATHGWCLYVRDTGRLWMGSVIVGQSYADREMNTIQIAPNTWTHVALVKDATGYTGYVNGVAGTKLMFANGLDYQPAQPLTVGALASQGEFPFVGYIDDLRITRGQAVYTANFTPPTAL